MVHKGVYEFAQIDNRLDIILKRNFFSGNGRNLGTVLFFQKLNFISVRFSFNV